MFDQIKVLRDMLLKILLAYTEKDHTNNSYMVHYYYCLFFRKELDLFRWVG